MDRSSVVIKLFLFFRSGRLCRKCLGLVDATPGALLGSAFGFMSETFQEEVCYVTCFVRLGQFKLGQVRIGLFCYLLFCFWKVEFSRISYQFCFRREYQIRVIYFCFSFYKFSRFCIASVVIKCKMLNYIVWFMGSN